MNVPFALNFRMRKQPKTTTMKSFAKRFVAGAFAAEIACLGVSYLFYRRTNRNPGQFNEPKSTCTVGSEYWTFEIRILHPQSSDFECRYDLRPKWGIENI